MSVKRPLNRLFPFALAFAWLPLLWFCYRGAFHAPFYGDTVYHLQERTNLHVASLSWRSLWAAAHLDFQGPLYRPISNWSLALNYYFWELRPEAYRVGNLLIHWAGSLALLFLFLAVLRSPKVTQRARIGKREVAAAWAGVALWSLHPIQTNVITYVIQRMASLEGLFAFLCVGSYLRGRSSSTGWSWRWASLALVSFGLALASKENGVTLLPLLILCEVVLLAPPDSPRLRGVLAGVALTAVFVSGVFLSLKGPALWARIAAGYLGFPCTMAQRLLTEARLQLQYLLVLLVPDPRLLTFDASVEVSTGLFRPPATAAALAALAGAVALAVRTARTKPVLCFGILWFVLAQAAESTVLPLELYFEHRMYVPSVFLYLGGSLLCARAFSARRPIVRFAGAGLLVAALATEAWATLNRNALWAHPVLFWADAVDKAPQKARTHLHFAEALIWHGFYPEAEKELIKAGNLGGTAGYVAFNRGTVAYRQGRLADAERLFREALRYPDIPAWLVHGRLADLSLESGRVEDALPHVRVGLQEKPDSADLWELLGRIRGAQGDVRLARAYLLRSLSFDPANKRVQEELVRLGLPPVNGTQAQGPGMTRHQPIKKSEGGQ